MGRGDKRTKRGKIWRGSYGKSRPRQSTVIAAKRPPAAAGGKPAAKKG